jgi:anhydro-N-acetylmuramic acid kinase
LTDTLGIGVDWVEAAAFAWLAKQTMGKLPSNLPAVTGAQGPRILGAIYPA